MIYDYLILLNRLKDKHWILAELGIDEKIDSVYIASINQNTLDGLRFRKVVDAPNLELKTMKQKNLHSMLHEIANIFKDVKE